MNTDSTSWFLNDTTINTEWDARYETPTELAGKLAQHCAAIEVLIPGAAVFDGATEPETPLPRDTEGWLALVERGIYIDDTDEERPDEPRSVSLRFRVVGLSLALQLRAGTGTAGRRRAANSLTIKVFPRGSELVAAQLLEDLVVSAAEIWQPACAAAWDLAGAQAWVGSEPQRWSPTPGQRSWVPQDLGVVSTTALGVTTRPTPSGTLLIADDSLTAIEAVTAMQETFLANGMTEIRHGASS
jgi:hypothetical protein